MDLYFLTRIKTLFLFFFFTVALSFTRFLSSNRPSSLRTISTLLFNTSASTGTCLATSLPYPNLYGAEFLSLEANLVTNLSTYIHIGLYSNHGAVNVTNVDFCNITVSYTHPGQNDTVSVQVWLPQQTWNGRMQHIGGAGFQAGLHFAGLRGMTAAVGEGYAALGTDAGLGSEATPVNWALLSPGNVNMYLLQDLISTSLNDASIIGKSLVNSYYGQPPAYSYFSGCSQGGRQGLMLAQRYPDAYDGIAASAPAINWNEFILGDYFPTLLMNEMGKYPAPCELDAITAAAISSCDGNDGVIDGVITDPDACDFDPHSLVGTLINCTDTGSLIQVSSTAALIAQASCKFMQGGSRFRLPKRQHLSNEPITINSHSLYFASLADLSSTGTGPRKVDDSFMWYGLEKGSALTASVSTGGNSVAATTCTSNGTCTSSGLELATDWMKLFLLKNASADVSKLTRGEYERLFHVAIQQYGFLDTNDPDLREFRDRGGKMITYHGLADLIIPPLGSKHYYDAVTAVDNSVHNYYRLFLAPGLDHCFGGAGAYPAVTFDALRNWVENGVAPETLMATSLMDANGNTITRLLCAYPKKQYYNRTGNSSESRTGNGFYCA